LLAPTRSTALLAKEAQSVDQISGGRLTLGLGVGARRDDFELTGFRLQDRGARFEQMLQDLREALAGKPMPGSDKPVAPEPVRPGGPPIVVGGTSDQALRRTAKYAIGWTSGGAPPEVVVPTVQRAREAWGQSGREGRPYIYALSYFSLGDEHVRTSNHCIHDHYRYFGRRGGEFAGRPPR